MEPQEDLLAEAVQEINDMVQASISHQMSVGDIVQSTFGTTGTITTSSSTSISGIAGGTTYYTIPSNPGYQTSRDYITELITLQDMLKPVEYKPQTILDNITQMIEALNRTASDDLDDHQNKAIKHLTFAKAYLDKMLLEKLNQNL